MKKFNKRISVTVPAHIVEAHEMALEVTDLIGGVTVQTVVGKWYDTEAKMWESEVNEVYTWWIDETASNYDEIAAVVTGLILTLLIEGRQMEVMFELGSKAYITGRETITASSVTANFIEGYLNL